MMGVGLWPAHDRVFLLVSNEGQWLGHGVFERRAFSVPHVCPEASVCQNGPTHLFTEDPPPSSFLPPLHLLSDFNINIDRKRNKKQIRNYLCRHFDLFRVILWYFESAWCIWAVRALKPSPPHSRFVNKPTLQLSAPRCPLLLSIYLSTGVGSPLTLPLFSPSVCSPHPLFFFNDFHLKL